MNKQVGQDTPDCLGFEPNDIARYMAKAAEARVPLSVSFELTRRCIFRCVHCYLGDQHSIRRHQQQELSTRSIFQLLDEMASAGTLLLTLTGGDPMLRPDFGEIYQYAIQRGFLVTVFCSGALITDAIVELFAAYPPRVVEITLYGATPKSFEAITQQTGSFAACMAGVERLRQGNVRLRLKTMVLTLNQADLPVLWQRVEEMGLPFRHDCSVIPALANADNSGHSNVGNTLHDTLRFRLAPEQAAAADLSIAQVREKLSGQAAASVEPLRTLYGCGAGRCSCHVTPYGTMQPCLITIQPSSALLYSQPSFQQVWDCLSKLFTGQKAQPGFLCADCRDKMICTGCPSNFILETGSREQPASFYCQYASERRAGIAAQRIAAS